MKARPELNEYPITRKCEERKKRGRAPNLRFWGGKGKGGKKKGGEIRPVSEAFCCLLALCTKKKKDKKRGKGPTV